MADDVHKQRFLIEIAIEPRSKVDKEKLGAALAKLVAEDPLFGTTTDPESGQTIIRGVAESQLARNIDILKHAYEVAAIIGSPQVAYLEMITQPATVDHTYKKLTGGHGQFARIKIVAEPNKPGFGFVFENQIRDDRVPQKFIPAVKSGLEGMMTCGVLGGFPVLEAWGFEYKTHIVWDKLTHYGRGAYVRTVHEDLLIGVRPKTPTHFLDSDLTSMIRHRLSRRNSEKPAVAHEYVQRATPGAGV